MAFGHSKGIVSFPVSPTLDTCGPGGQDTKREIPQHTRGHSPGSSRVPWAWQLWGVPLDILTDSTPMRWIHRNCASPPFRIRRGLGVAAGEAAVPGIGMVPSGSRYLPLF